MLRFLPSLKDNNPLLLRFCSTSCDLHYFYTRNFFIATFMLSITKQLFGDSITCCCVTNKIPKDTVDTSCFLNGTFTYINESYYGLNIHLPKYYHNYYQWIPLIFVLESLAFSFPHWIWETIVGNYIKQLSIKTTKLDESYCNFIVSELKNSEYMFYLKHVILDMFYFANVLFQMLLLNICLNNDFIQFSEKLFPIYTNCHFTWMESSDYSLYKLKCILPLNILYEKIFKIVWFGCYALLVIQLFILLKRLFEWIHLPFKRYMGPLSHDTNKWFLYQIVKSNIAGENYWYIHHRLKEC